MVTTDNRRGSSRVDTVNSVCIKAFDEKDGAFSDITPALDVSKDGMAFASKLPVYYLGMRLRVTYPYSAAMQKHYNGKIVRIQRLDENFQRISVQLSPVATLPR